METLDLLPVEAWVIKLENLVPDVQLQIFWPL
jgi:hypothetical protein